MALEAGSSAAPYSPHVVAGAFVKQYYQTLLSARQDAYKFYNNSSILGRSDSNGNMVSVTTIDEIKEQLVSADFTDSLIELETVDSQPSHVGGVIISVAGSFTIDTVKQKFTQSFFLAPQKDGGYFVLNDMFRLARPLTQVNDVVANHDIGKTQSITLQAEPETASINGSTVPNIPPTGNLSVPDEVMGTSPNVVNDDTEKIPEATPAPPALAEKAVNKDTEKIPEAAPRPAFAEKAVNKPVAAPAPALAEKVVNKPVAAPAPALAEKAVNKPVAAPAPASAEKAGNKPVAAPAPPASAEKAVNKPVAAPAPPASAEKEVTKKTYASIVKTTREGMPPTPTVKPKPIPRPTQNVEKPSKPDNATNAAPPGDKNVSKHKSSDEPEYSVFVKNLPYEATVEMVEQEFNKFGAIKSGGIQVKKCQPDRFCFGFVEFESQDSMLAAIEASSVYFGSREAYIEEKRTKTRVVDGVITRGDDNGSRFQSGRCGYHGDNNYRVQGGFRNNGYYNDGGNFRRPQGNGSPQNGGNNYNQNGGNGYHQNRNGYPQNGNGYHQNGNGYQQRRPYSNGNGRPRQQQAPAAA